MTRAQALAALHAAIEKDPRDEVTIRARYEDLRREHPATAAELLLRLSLPGFEV